MAAAAPPYLPAADASTLRLPPEASYRELLDQTCALGMAAAPLWVEALAAGGERAKSVAMVRGAPGIACADGDRKPINDAGTAFMNLKEMRDPATALP